LFWGERCGGAVGAMEVYESRGGVA